MIILDTNVVSEMMRPEPAAAVLSWLRLHSATSLATTAITRAELLYGVALLPEGRRKALLHKNIEDVLDADFRTQMFPFDVAAADHYADIAAVWRQRRRVLDPFDAAIAAIARAQGAVLATRNVDDFADCGVEVVNPWVPVG